MSNSTNLVVTEAAELPAGTYQYDRVTIESSGILTCNGTVQITSSSFTLHEGGLIIVSDKTTINADTFTKDVASN